MSITATTSEVTPVVGSDEIYVPDGRSINVAIDGNFAGAEYAEIRQRVGGSFESIADSEDTIDASKKILNTSNTTRTVTGPIVIGLYKQATASAAGVYIS